MQLQDLAYRLLMSPFSVLYGVGISLRDLFYQAGLLRSAKFDIPTISIGNLSVGGAGKTPHVEYLVQYLDDYLEVGTLSRGYKRKTKGFIIVEPTANALQAGDEPVQYKQKFPNIMVAVAEERTFAIPQMLMTNPELQVILLDDAFQHRAITPGLNILLTDHQNLFTRDWLMPSGRLREWRSAYHRADIIIVSKCPKHLTEKEKQDLVLEIRPMTRQKMFFSCYNYLPPYSLFNEQLKVNLESDMEVVLISAIANTEYLLDYLRETVERISILEYPDHHLFGEYDLTRLKNTFASIEAPKKIILTTEKDATRLTLHRKFLFENRLPVFVLPVEVGFLFDEEEAFLSEIRNFLMNFRI
ncbi:MAG: tetraacyldisaccharide 4'-kinase [Bacteroidota bacterium]